MSENTEKTDTTSKLETLRAAKAVREREAQARAEALELEELELEDQLTRELGSREDRNFEVVSTPWGVFGVKKPDARGIQSWNRMKEDQQGKKVNIDQLAERSRSILRHYIVPEAKQQDFLQLAAERPAVVDRVGMAFLYLLGNEVVDSSKKF